MTKLKAHPLAERMPEMTPAKFEALKASIAANKQRRPIILFQGKILDGRHRYRACLELGIEPKFEEFKGDYADAVQLVMDEETHRNPTEGQMVCAAELFMDDLVKSGTKSGTGGTKSSEIAALRFGVSRRYVEEVRKIRKSAPHIYNDLFGGKLNVNQALNRMKQHGRAAEVRKVNRTAAKAPSKHKWEVRQGDCLEVMDLISANAFRIVFSDFPYNIGWKYDGDPHADRMADDQYVAWCAAVIDQGKRILTDDGSMFILVDDKYSDFVGVEMRRAGLHRQATIVWWESFAAHNSAETGLTCRTRYLHYYTKRDEGFIFNTNVRVPSARQAIYNDSRANPAGMIPSNVWQVSRKQGTANDRVPFDDAPPQIPTEIIERCILLASNEGDAVFDPCTGNGTTAIAACQNGRTFVGSERSRKYAKQARQWIAAQLAKEGAK